VDYKLLEEAIKKSRFRKVSRIEKELKIHQGNLQRIFDRKDNRQLSIDRLEEICNAIEIHPYYFLSFNPVQRKSAK